MRNTFLVALCLLAGCTTPILRDTSLIDEQSKKCENVDCVIDLMDTLPQGPDDERFRFMEGFPDPKLRTMKDSGKLTVEPINPLFLTLMVYGYANFESHPYGGMDTCDARYLPGFNWTLLKHELAHCQVYADKGIPIMYIGYSDPQKAIMEKEGVSKWTDTQFHKNNLDNHTK